MNTYRRFAGLGLYSPTREAIAAPAESVDYKKLVEGGLKVAGSLADLYLGVKTSQTAPEASRPAVQTAALTEGEKTAGAVGFSTGAVVGFGVLLLIMMSGGKRS